MMRIMMLFDRHVNDEENNDENDDAISQTCER